MKYLSTYIRHYRQIATLGLPLLLGQLVECVIGGLRLSLIELVAIHDGTILQLLERIIRVVWSVSAGR